LYDNEIIKIYKKEKHKKIPKTITKLEQFSARLLRCVVAQVRPLWPCLLGQLPHVYIFLHHISLGLFIGCVPTRKYETNLLAILKLLSVSFYLMGWAACDMRARLVVEQKLPKNEGTKIRT
jgi:hypothetical protein